MRERLTFDDISIVPRYSEITSRNCCNTEVEYAGIELTQPLFEMAKGLGELGGLGIIHRFNPIEEQLQGMLELEELNIPYGVAVGVGEKAEHRIDQLLSWTNLDVMCIDVAHGHHKMVKDTIAYIKDIDEDMHVLAGNICTTDAAWDLEGWGADSLRVGIGNGSMCETRIRAGVGIPQVNALLQCIETVDIPIISDGGCKTTGDVAKALGLGSDLVMIGSLFAGTKETPGIINKSGMWPNEQLYKKYQGSASIDSKLARGETNHVEGNSKILPYKGKVKRIVDDINDGIRSSMSYVGALNLYEFKNKVEFVRVTQAGQLEAKPHGLY
jgi:IMP dehydrogenase